METKEKGWGWGKKYWFWWGEEKGRRGGNTTSLYLQYVFFSDKRVLSYMSNWLVSHYLPI